MIESYDADKYWKRRKCVISPTSKTPQIIEYLYLLYLRKCDANNCASIATGIGAGATFASPPKLPHGLKGIIIHPTAIIGHNCTIMQFVTIGTRQINKGAVIGDNVFIGAGAKILGNIQIGDNVKIGANAVVLEDVPDNCTVVGIPAKIVAKR